MEQARLTNELHQTYVAKILAPLGQFLPAHQNGLAIPDGFVRLCDARNMIIKSASRWGIGLDWADVNIGRRVADRIGKAASLGQVKVAGFLDGSVSASWFPAAAWLTPFYVRGRPTYPAFHACRGNLVAIPGELKSTPCQPFISCYDLAALFDAADAPLYPTSAASEIHEFGTEEKSRMAMTVETAESSNVQSMTLTYVSGTAGRPTSMHLLERELRRRASSGEMCSTLKQEANSLALWLATGHPMAAPATAKTIRNRICHLYRELRRPQLADDSVEHPPKLH